jgi:hypothetical protein
MWIEGFKFAVMRCSEWKGGWKEGCGACYWRGGSRKEYMYVEDSRKCGFLECAWTFMEWMEVKILYNKPC